MLSNEVLEAQRKIKDKRDIDKINYIDKFVRPFDEEGADLLKTNLIWNHLALQQCREFESLMVTYIIKNNLMTREEVIKMMELSGKEDCQLIEIEA